MAGSKPPAKLPPAKIAIIGAGTIGLSFAALHLSHSHSVTIYDTRDDIFQYVRQTLPTYLSTLLPPSAATSIFSSGKISIVSSLKTAVANADIIQEQGPEHLDFKRHIWREIEQHASPRALFWSSTSGIPASSQAQDMKDKTRLLVVHPYNPPHIMPLLEIVPTQSTQKAAVSKTVAFWRNMGREPVLVKKEAPGFVANRLAFALLKEAVHLVREGVVGVEDVDKVVQASMGPRWAVAGPFKSYHAGGGEGGLEAFMEKIGWTVQRIWDDLGELDVRDDGVDAVWKEAMDRYGKVEKEDFEERDAATLAVMAAARSGDG